MADRDSPIERMIRRDLLRRGIRDGRVIDVMRRVPREEFVPEKERRRAYGDHPLPIGDGQTISQPYMVAAMTEILLLTGKERVLEIGTGSGYQTAVLAELAREVHTVERMPRLAARARTRLVSMGYENVRFRVADGTAGWREAGPFDRILITAAAPQVPQAILDQLADPGILTGPVGPKGVQQLVSVRRIGGRDETTRHFSCAFVPLIGLEGFPD